MSFRINSNVASLTANRHLGMAQRELEHSLQALASGERFTNASVDAAGLAISESLRAQIASTDASVRNAESALSFLQVAEGSLNEQNNILIRQRELAIQAASDTLSDKEREFLDMEFSQLNEELDRIARTSRYGNQNLLTGMGRELSFHVGAQGGKDDRITFELDVDTTSGALNMEGVRIHRKGSAHGSLNRIDKAIMKVVEARASFGALQSRLDHARTHMESQVEGLSAARSRIADTDVARETANLVRSQITTRMATAVLAQANSIPEHALALI